MPKLDHASIAVKDWRASRDWYVEVLGLKLEFDAPQGGTDSLGVAALQDDSGLTLFVEQVRQPVSACRCTHTFQVPDVEAAHARIAASGITFLKSPQKLFWGYGAEIADPDGHIIRLWDEKTMREKGGSE